MTANFSLYMAASLTQSILFPYYSAITLHNNFKLSIIQNTLSCTRTNTLVIERVRVPGSGSVLLPSVHLHALITIVLWASFVFLVPSNTYGYSYTDTWDITKKCDKNTIRITKMEW